MKTPFRSSRATWLCCGMLITHALVGSGARAQGIRISGVTSMQGVDLRPLIDDSVAVGSTTGTGPYRVLANGRLVRCVEGGLRDAGREDELHGFWGSYGWGSKG